MGMSRIGISALLLSATVVTVAPAQRSTDLGVMAGGAFSKFRGADRGILDQTKVGIAGGIFLSLGLAPEFAFQPEVLYVQKGGKDAADDESFELSYIEIPILAKFRLPPSGYATQLSPHFYVGGAFGLKVGCHATVAPASGSCKDLGLRIKSSDFNVVVGAGLNFGRAMVDARFDLGFTKIEDSPLPDDVKNSTLYLLAGWTFRVPR